MTENSWLRDESLETPPVAPQVPERQAAVFPPTGNRESAVDSSTGADSKSEAAKDEAAEVAQHATAAVQGVAGTAKDEAAHIVAEAKVNARDLITQAMSDLSEQAAIQQKRIAEGLRSVAEELHSMVSASDQPGIATDLVRQAAERSEAVGTWLNDRDPASLMADVKSFARHKPGTFLLLAAGAGIVAGRLSRSLSAGAPDSAVSATTGDESFSVTASGAGAAMTTPPTPADTQGVDTLTGGSDAAYPPPPLGNAGDFSADQFGTETQPSTDRPEPWNVDPVVPNPLPADDPLRDGPLKGGPR